MAFAAETEDDDGDDDDDDSDKYEDDKWKLPEPFNLVRPIALEVNDDEQMEHRRLRNT